MLPFWSFGSNETWCMIGYHAASVLADMIVKDVKGFDHERAFEAMVTTAMNDHYDCLPEYRSLGYVPFDKEAESVSKTLEYAYDDYAIAMAAKKLGKEKEYNYFLNRAMSYQNLYDKETKYMRGKDVNGNWRTPFAPVAYEGPGSVNGWGDITEGFTVQYHWTVPQDVQGLMNLKLSRRGMAVPEVGAHRCRPVLRRPAWLALWQRRLRTDVGMVHLQLHGLLSSVSFKRHLQHWVARTARYRCDDEQWQAHTRDHKELEQEGAVRQQGDAQRQTV